MMNIREITAFTPVDFQAVEQLLAQFVPNAVLTEEAFREIVESSGSHLFVVEYGEGIAGMLTVGVYASPTGSKAWIEDVVVDSTCRGAGLGKALVEHAIASVKAAGIGQLMLTSNPSRIAANGLYRALGFSLKETNVYWMQFEEK